MKNHLFLFITSPLVCLLLSSCSFRGPWNSKNSLKLSAPPLISDTHGKPESLIAALDQNAKYLGRISPQVSLTFGRDTYSVDAVRKSLQELNEKLKELGLTEEFFNYVRKNFNFYESRAPEVLFTGYYEASLNGSLKRHGPYQYPIYGKPKDLVRIDLAKFFTDSKPPGLPATLRGRVTSENRVEPYYSRHEIDYQNKLNGLGAELAWVDDPLALFFLHIQGSGVLTLDNGKELRVNYADINGQVYKAIGALLLKEGTLPKKEISMQSIRAYLKSHPERVQEVLSYNPSYVFFRVVDDGPIGSTGVKLTPYRSIATDSAVFPKGTLCLIEQEIPEFNGENVQIGTKKTLSFVLNQDSGGAIKGPGRIDLFTGRGAESELVAGHLKSQGKIYFLAPKIKE